MVQKKSSKEIEDHKTNWIVIAIIFIVFMTALSFHQLGVIDALQDKKNKQQDSTLYIHGDMLDRLRYKDEEYENK